ncbi:TM2 domain-containing protein [Paenibacillus sp. P96]|uniref:TM2 domain-containing protein n=1 Tax=Paenibacillus zeirhizosphaerae TaxID=2987519 RepID=A0ABT9FX39_9BACL|nr:TM2 domain-containing protein [Paenibacillus sp. P96]MDP4099299.1 TM2 domain-containing protein [Paenibacillus sp. P96]
MKLTKDQLTVNEMLILNSAMRDTEKSLALAYIMLIGGHLGVHRFYLKRIATAVAQLILFILAFIFYIVFSVTVEVEGGPFMMLSGILLVLFGGALTVWVIVDLFLMPRMVREWNQRIEDEIITQIYQLRLTNKPHI